MSELGVKTDLKIGKVGYSLNAITSGKRGFCYFDDKRYEILAGSDIRKWAEVFVITLTAEPTVIETWSAFPLSYQTPTGGYQAVSAAYPLPVVTTLTAAQLQAAILQTLQQTEFGSRNPTGIPIFFDGFDYPLTSWDGVAAINGALGWDQYVAGSTIARNTAYKYKGTGCLGITSGAVAYGGYYARKTIPVPQNKKIGLELYLAVQTATQNFYYSLFGIGYNSTKTGVNDLYAIDVGTPLGGVMTISDTGFKLLPSMPNTIDAALFTANVYWHYAKLVVDLSKRTFVHLYFDGSDIDLTGLIPFSGGTPPTTYDQLFIQLGLANGGVAAACLTLFDEVLVTSNEP